jgi:hypothetical protein
MRLVMKRNMLAAAFVLAGTILAGCGGGYVMVAGPPPPRYGVMGYAPGPGYVWTEGFYDLRGSSWVWTSGTWRRPPRPGAVWASAAWRQEGRGWRFHRGYWR